MNTLWDKGSLQPNSKFNRTKKTKKEKNRDFYIKALLYYFLLLENISCLYKADLLPSSAPTLSSSEDMTEHNHHK